MIVAMYAHVPPHPAAGVAGGVLESRSRTADGAMKCSGCATASMWTC